MTDRDSMRDASHTHPYTGETFGHVYKRGPAVADGGETRAPDAEETGAESEEPMAEVDHEAPDGEGASEVWKRGRGDVDE
jgi:hypothetical protein